MDAGRSERAVASEEAKNPPAQSMTSSSRGTPTYRTRIFENTSSGGYREVSAGRSASSFVTRPRGGATNRRSDSGTRLTNARLGRLLEVWFLVLTCTPWVLLSFTWGWWIFNFRRISVFLLSTLRKKTAEQIFVKILLETHLWTRKIHLTSMTCIIYMYTVHVSWCEMSL